MDSTASSGHVELIGQHLQQLISSMGFSVTVQAENTVFKGLVFNIDLGNDSYLLIGHRGSHLHALEVLMQAIIARKNPGQYIKFSLDVDDYRRKREWYVKETVRGAIEQLKRTGRGLALEPMPNYERKLVHSLIQANHPEVESTSSGIDPRRRVIIRNRNVEGRMQN